MANNFLEEATKMLTTQSRKKEWYEGQSEIPFPHLPYYGILYVECERCDTVTFLAEIEDEICSICPKMTYQQRIGGCVSFMVLGFLISLGSFTR